MRTPDWTAQKSTSSRAVPALWSTLSLLLSRTPHNKFTLYIYIFVCQYRTKYIRVSHQRVSRSLVPINASMHKPRTCFCCSVQFWDGKRHLTSFKIIPLKELKNQASTTVKETGWIPCCSTPHSSRFFNSILYYVPPLNHIPFRIS